MLITSIDVGIIHFGLTMVEVSESYELRSILFCRLIDMTVMRHNTVSREQCKLHHDNCTADWITHLVQEYPKPFYNSDIIINAGPLMMYFRSFNVINQSCLN